MNTKHWIKIESILDEVLQRPLEKQKDYLKKACGDNAALLDDVMEMWKAIKESEKTQFLQKATSENMALIEELTHEEQQSSFIDRRIGKYKITEKIGSGGMGGVFKAVRVDGQFTRDVAIKLVPNGFHSSATLKRFQLEKRILAGLSHQNIARLYDGGITQEGHPYLVMEYIDGLPIDEYCNQNKLSVEERLELFKNVCKAVEFAHHNLVIHRDLKCKNIFVSAEWEVKVLDFGIAKLLDPKLDEDELISTLPGYQFWTPYYASPEQVLGEQITTATDVYSLGILLHRLLTDTYAFDFEGKSITEIRSIITEQSPLKLTQAIKLHADESTLPLVAKNRSITTRELKKRVSGDLEAIVSKATRCEPDQRYHAVGALEADLTNYEQHLPIKARRDSFLYKFHKFTKRHKTGVITIFLLALFIGGLSTIYTFQLSKRQKRAEFEANKARRVENLLINIFKQSSPFNQNQAGLTLKEVLDQGSINIDRELKDQPLVKSELEGLMGQIYTNLGLYAKAKPLLTEALHLQKINPRKEPEVYYKNLRRLAYLQFRQEHYREAEKLYLKSIQEAKALYTLRSSKLAQLYHDTGFLYDEMGQRKKAVSYYQTALDLMNDDQVKLHAQILDDWGLIYQKQDQFVKAIALINQSIQLRRSSPATIDPELANSYNDLAYTYQRYGKLMQADSLHQIALGMREKLFSPNHPHIASSLVRYGRLKVQEGQLKKADTMLSRGYDILQKHLPGDHWQVLSAKGGLALCRGLEGASKNNLAILDSVSREFGTRFGPKDWRSREAKKAYLTLLNYSSRERKKE